MDPATTIPKTSISITHILGILQTKHERYQKLCLAGYHVASFDAINISKNLGHGSIVYKLVFYLVSENNNLTPETIVVALKVPKAEYYIKYRGIPKESEGDITEMISGLHKCECNFYENIAPMMNLKIPKIYATKLWDYQNQDEGYILMEDMTEEGVVLTKYEIMSLEQIKAVIKEIAHIQAEYFKLPSSAKNDPEHLSGWLPGPFIKQIPAFIDLLDDKDKVKTAQLLEKIQVNVEANLHSIKFYGHLKLPKVMIHGDLWNSNIFFKKAADGKAGNEVVAFIDWQASRESSPTADICRFLILGTDGETRRRAETTVLDFYLQCLQSELPDVPFNLNQIKKLYYRTFIPQTCNLINITVFNVNTLKRSIAANNGDLTENMEMISHHIDRALAAIEDVSKIFDDNLAGF